MSYRVGLPRYANVAPLTAFLRPRGFTLLHAVPTELNRRLLAGELDLSLVSSVFYLEHRQRFGLLPDFSVAVLGRVYSVNLFARVPWEKVRRVALTTESATSVRLLKLLLGPGVAYRTASGGLELLRDYDGVLLIGDRAVVAYAGLLDAPPENVHDLPPRPGGIYVSDLAERWYRRTRLPFVFALWAFRREAPPPEEVVRALRQARRQGLGHLAEVAKAESRRLGVAAPLLEHYLWNFRYHFEAPDRDGLAAFANALGLTWRAEESF